MPFDLRRPGPCPACGSTEKQYERCRTCVQAKFYSGLATPVGELLLRVFDLESALAMRMAVTMDDVTAEEFWALKTLRHERDRKQEEDREAEDRKARERQRKTHGPQIFPSRD
jgi:hypothetical protein